MISTTARFRNKNIKHIKLEDLKKIDFKKKCLLCLDLRASGLSNKEISFSNYVLQIPTNPSFKSLNLSHSLIIIASTLYNFLNKKKFKNTKSKKIKQASKRRSASNAGSMY